MEEENTWVLIERINDIRSIQKSSVFTLRSIFIFFQIKLNIIQMEKESDEIQSAFLENPSKTNEVLVEDKGNTIFYYLPCYLRFKVKNIEAITMESLAGSASGAFLMDIYYGDLEDELLEQFIRTSRISQEDFDFRPIVMQFSRGEQIELVQSLGITIKQDKKQKLFTITVRKIFQCSLEGDLLLSPFQLIHLYLCVTLQPSNLLEANNAGKKVVIRFNCMDSDVLMKVNHSEQCTFGNYDLSESLITVKYSNDSIIPFGENLKKKQENAIKKEKKQQEEKTRQKSEEFLSEFFSKASKNSKNSQQSEIGSLLSAIMPSSPKKKQKDQEQEHIVTQRQFQSLKIVKASLQSEQFKEKKQEKKPKQLTKKKKAKKPSVKYFQYAFFRIPLYKYPGSSIVTVFIPLWLLGILNLAIFFQDFDFGGRVSALATLTLAFVSLIPTIRSQVPPNPNILLVQMLVYLETSTSLLCLAVSFLHRNVGQDYVYDWTTDIFFLISLLVTLTNIAIIVVLFIIHKVVWEPHYNEWNQGKKPIDFIRQCWGNYEADKAFAKFPTIIPLKEWKEKKRIEEEKEIKKQSQEKMLKAELKMKEVISFQEVSVKSSESITRPIRLKINYNRHLNSNPTKKYHQHQIQEVEEPKETKKRQVRSQLSHQQINKQQSIERESEKKPSFFSSILNMGSQEKEVEEITEIKPSTFFGSLTESVTVNSQFVDEIKIKNQ